MTHIGSHYEGLWLSYAHIKSQCNSKAFNVDNYLVKTINQILSTFFSFLNSSVPGGRARWLFGTISGVLTPADIGTTFISKDTIQTNFQIRSVYQVNLLQCSLHDKS